VGFVCLERAIEKEKLGKRVNKRDSDCRNYFIK